MELKNFTENLDALFAKIEDENTHCSIATGDFNSSEWYTGEKTFTKY